ncbi:hypothetical protein D3H55_20255 [Bacillus salacetis]|uniref:Uncharacterized protein n=1 Tax=Bacillus salacetis TaxID=2315464 RepID=A0A3A1QQY0_9BACI|nr:hypothetical protein D3H55_20255 [Bacillus salacetis]
MIVKILKTGEKSCTWDFSENGFFMRKARNKFKSIINLLKNLTNRMIKSYIGITMNKIGNTKLGRG